MIKAICLCQYTHTHSILGSYYTSLVYISMPNYSHSNYSLYLLFPHTLLRFIFLKILSHLLLHHLGNFHSKLFLIEVYLNFQNNCHRITSIIYKGFSSKVEISSFAEILYHTITFNNFLHNILNIFYQICYLGNLQFLLLLYFKIMCLCCIEMVLISGF